MTLEETRQLGIEFERRVQTMIPERELIEKMDTETIYSFLNQFQDQLIHDMYRAIDQIPLSNAESYIETLLNSMIETTNPLAVTAEGPVYTCELPSNFGLYIKSYSEVSSSYRMKKGNGAGILPNEIISVKDANKAISKP